MTIQHSCSIPRKDLPRSISTMTQHWRCPICGQFWWVTYSGASYCARRTPSLLPNIRHFLWKRHAKRELVKE